MLTADNDHYEYKNWRMTWSTLVPGMFIMDHIVCEVDSHVTLDSGGTSQCLYCGTVMSQDIWDHLRRAHKFLAPSTSSSE